MKRSSILALFAGMVLCLSLSSVIIADSVWSEPGTVERVSVSSTGTQGNAPSPGHWDFCGAGDGCIRQISMSGNGRHISFVSFATNLDPNWPLDPNQGAVFMHDRATGTTRLVSPPDLCFEDYSSDQQWGYTPIIDPYARYLAYSGPRDGGNSNHITLLDIDEDQYSCYAPDLNLSPSAENWYRPITISAFARQLASYVTFSSSSLLHHPVVYVIDYGGINEFIVPSPDWFSDYEELVFPRLSANGRWLAGVKWIASPTQVYVYDVQAHTDPPVLISKNSDGTPGNYWSGQEDGVSISWTGRYVAFESVSTNLVDLNTNGHVNIFVHDRDANENGDFDDPNGVSTILITRNNEGGAANGSSRHPSISANGRFVAFSSGASNLVADDTNNRWDIFVHDRDANNNGIFDEEDEGATLTVRISLDPKGAQLTDDSESPVISADGQVVAFASFSPNLVSGDTNQVVDAFVYNARKCAGDANADGRVDLADLSIVVASWGLCFGDEGYDPLADLNWDGCVGLADYNLVAEDYNVCGF